MRKPDKICRRELKYMTKKTREGRKKKKGKRSNLHGDSIDMAHACQLGYKQKKMT